MGDTAGRGSGPGESVSQATANAYSNAPDLGVASTLQYAYDKTPSLGEVQQRINDGVNTAAATSGLSGRDQQGGSQEGQDKGDAPERGTEQESAEKEQSGRPGPSLEAISRERGPSSKDRLNKSQKELGTEYGIPTTAGAGSTLSPDVSNQEAAKKEEKKGKQSKAAVPEDYAPQPCPEENAGTGKVDDVQKEAAGGGRGLVGEGSHGNAEENEMSGNNVGTGIEDKNTPKGRDTVDRVKDGIKGNLKVLKGRLARDDEKVAEGKALKHGDA